MTDEIKNRLEHIKGSLIYDIDERLQQCTLNDLDYIEFLNDQEFTEIRAIQAEINTCTSLRKANTMLNMLLDDIAAYGDKIIRVRDRLLLDMEQSANRQNILSILNSFHITDPAEVDICLKDIQSRGLTTEDEISKYVDEYFTGIENSV